MILAFECSTAVAATIDEFQVPASVSSPETVGPAASIYTAHSRAIGGGRALTARKTSAGTGVGVTRIETIAAGGIIGVTQGDHGGFASVIWDGDTDPSNLKANGLGAIDLTKDDADAFRLVLRSFDYAYSEVMTITLRLYDPSLPSGNKFSQVDITINQAINPISPRILSIPFSAFLTSGTSTVSGFPANTIMIGGGASAKNVGAIALEFTGFAGDLTAGLLSTNGRCTAVPNANGLVLDECEVCLNDSANSNQGRDACGVCFNGPPGYDYDLNKVFDACGFCPGHPQFQYPGGKKDACGICGGTETDPVSCDFNASVCVTVTVTPEISKFEKDLVSKARLLRTRYMQERSRSRRNRCNISTTASDTAITAAFRHIVTRSQEIFSAGVEVCGDACVTTTYATQVEALKPEFKALQQQTLSLAKKVNACYSSRGVARSAQGRQRSVASTVGSVNRGLNNLIAECRKKRVCPPGSK